MFGCFGLFPLNSLESSNQVSHIHHKNRPDGETAALLMTPPKIDPFYVKLKHFRQHRVWKTQVECDRWGECGFSQCSLITGTFQRFTGKNTRRRWWSRECCGWQWNSCFWQNLCGQARGVRSGVRDDINWSFRNERVECHSSHLITANTAQEKLSFVQKEKTNLSKTAVLNY